MGLNPAEVCGGGAKGGGRISIPNLGIVPCTAFPGGGNGGGF